MFVEQRFESLQEPEKGKDKVLLSSGNGIMGIHLRLALLYFKCLRCTEERDAFGFCLCKYFRDRKKVSCMKEACKKIVLSSSFDILFLCF